MENNLVSIIIPVYNAEMFLEDCIVSILSQTYKELEIIIVDDGSVDGSTDISKKFEQIDNRVKLIKKNNEGVSIARNTGIEAASGQYICFVDADDYLEEDYIAFLVNKIKEYDLPVVYCNHKLRYNRTLVTRLPRIAEGKYSVEKLEDKLVDDGTITGILFGSVWGALYRTDLILEQNLRFNKNIKRNEDGLFNLCLLQHCKDIYVSDYSGYIYRQWKTNSKNVHIPDVELDKATLEIKECCSTLKDIYIQIHRRNVSVIFWNAIKVENIPFFKAIRWLKEYLNQNNIEEDYQYLNFSDMTKAKKLLIKMIYKKHGVIFTLFMKTGYPIFKKLIRR